MRPHTVLLPKPVDRAAVIRAAVALADAEGLQAVSVGGLARRSGVSEASLYRHVAGYDDLVSAMVDAVLSAPATAVPGCTDWRVLLEQEARQEWELYQRHPWAVQVLATSRPPLGTAVLAAVDRYFTALPTADPHTALSIYLLVSGYVQGMAALTAAESAATRTTGVSNQQWWSTHVGKLAGAVHSNRYPWLTALAEAPASQASNVDTWFSFGLDRVLDGVAHYLA